MMDRGRVSMDAYRAALYRYGKGLNRGDAAAYGYLEGLYAFRGTMDQSIASIRSSKTLTSR